MAGDQDTASMRAQADQLRAAREDYGACSSGRAGPLSWTGKPACSTRRRALAELGGARQRTPRLQSAVGEAITAEDRLRKDEQRLRRPQADQQKARAEHADGDRQEANL